MRFFYTIVNTYHYYNTLKSIFKNKNKVFNTVTDITENELSNFSIQVLALDFDGVLNSHGEPLPRPEVIQWIEKMQSVLGSHNIFILSNKPLVERIDFFKTYFPDIEFIQGVRKKPYPDGLEKIFNLKNITLDQRSSVVLVDDRLLTGMLATCIAGCEGFYIKRPFVNFHKRPFAEAFFQILRYTERFLFGF